MQWLHRHGARVALALALLVSAAAASGAELTVLAAASLRESFTELAHRFEVAHPGAHVRITFAGSQQLAASILLDAPADVFASADTVQMDRVIHAGDASRARELCSNRLVIAVNRQAAARIHSLADLGRGGIRVVVAANAVPAGAYTLKLLAKLPAAEARAIEANVRSREADVRTVLTRVALGEADAGVVYATDVAAAKSTVLAVPIGAAVQSPVAYMIAALTHAREPNLAAGFVDLVLSPEGAAVLRRRGFIVGP